MHTQGSRRRFLVQALSGSGVGLWMARSTFANFIPPTAAQTKGPFYPVPEIEKQKYFDADLTRLDANSPVADGEQIAVHGLVLDMDEKPLDQAIVEVWQACATGRYNHPQDRNDRPMDPNFQYWARIITGPDGKFSIRTIQPGKYPARTPHLHYRIVAPNRSELVTQMYFEANQELNRKDGIYMDLKPEQRAAVTIGLESKAIAEKDPNSEKLPTGEFRIVMGPRSDTKSTQPM